MFNASAGRVAIRASRLPLQTPLALSRCAGRRHLTTAPPHATSRSWKNSAVRWGLAAAGIYYYNTSPIFAEYPQSNLLNPNVDAFDNLPENSTIDQLTASSRNKTQKNAGTLQKTIEASSEDLAMQQQQKPNPDSKTNQSAGLIDTAPETEGAAELEEEAGQEGAFNPVTGEINWDCPCLGGMAYGPCGEQFRAAFSCFIYSNEEPKGMECIDKFQNMQDCFRAHPEVYKDEIEDNESLDDELAQEKEELHKEIADRRASIEAQEAGKASSRNLLELEGSESAANTTSDTSRKSSARKQGDADKKQSRSKKAQKTTQPPSEHPHESETEHGATSSIVSDQRAPSVSVDAQPESEFLVPKAAHDATDAAQGTKSIAKA